MIQFHLERSGVPAYLQLVQQVRQAIRLGVLRPGDQLPTVKEVVGTLTINPNTVLRAYRQLDLEGLIEGRRGVGTFVAAGCHAAAARRAERPSLGVAALAHARTCGRPRRRCDRDALLRHSPATVRLEGRMTAAIRTEQLGKRYGSTWALPRMHARDPCRLGDGARRAERRRQDDAAAAGDRPGPADRGRGPRARARALADAAALLPRVGFVAQDHPLHRSFTVGAMLKFGRCLNPTWDEEAARARLARLGIPLDRKVGKLSGGQQAQVALTLALAKCPELLILDEPVASLDPLARREFMNTVMEVVSERQLTVVLSSHIVADLERVCDHLVILSHARTLVAAPIDEVLAGHRLLTGPRADATSVARVHEVIRESHTERQTSLLVRANGHVYDASWQVHEVDLEEIVLAYLGYGAPLELREAVAS